MDFKPVCVEYSGASMVGSCGGEGSQQRMTVVKTQETFTPEHGEEKQNHLALKQVNILLGIVKRENH